MELNKKTYLREELEQLSTPQLEQMLRAELKKAPPDGELVRSLLRTLEARTDEYTAEDDEEIEAACREYREYWEGVEAEEKRKSSNVRRLVLRAASIAVIVGLLCFGTLQAVEAGCFRDMLEQWTESFYELFGASYVNNDEVEYVFETDNPGLRQVYEAVVELGITYPAVPTWLPEGFELQEIKHTNTPSKTGMYVRFINGKNEITFTVDIYDPDVAHVYLKDEPTPDVHEYDGNVHDIIENGKNMTAIWSEDNIGFSISADCQKDTLCEILNSIYVTEAE